MRRLSRPQLQALQDTERCGNPWARVYGQSQHGGWTKVVDALIRKDFIRHRRNRWELTEAGKAALREERERSAQAFNRALGKA